MTTTGCLPLNILQSNEDIDTLSYKKNGKSYQKKYKNIVQEYIEEERCGLRRLERHQAGNTL